MAKIAVKYVVRWAVPSQEIKEDGSMTNYPNSYWLESKETKEKICKIPEEVFDLPLESFSIRGNVCYRNRDTQREANNIVIQELKKRSILPEEFEEETIYNKIILSELCDIVIGIQDKNASVNVFRDDEGRIMDYAFGKSNKNICGTAYTTTLVCAIADIIYANQIDENKNPRSRSGAYLKAQRLAEDMTQSQLGKIIGNTARIVGKWETNEKIPNVQSLKKLSAALKFDINNYLEYIG